MRAAVAYIRVSKPKQGRSGLGLEAQQAAIKTFCAQHGYKVEAEYREVETGKGADALDRRPQLAAALADGCPWCARQKRRHFATGAALREALKVLSAGIHQCDDGCGQIFPEP